MMDPWLILGAVLILMVISALLMLPLTPGFHKRKKRQRHRSEPPPQDWAAMAARLSRQLKEIRREKGELITRIKVLEHRIEQEKDKAARWEQRYQQVKKWERKESEDLQKLASEKKRLSQEVGRLDQALAEAQGTLLRLHKECDELKQERDELLRRDERQKKEILIFQSRVEQLNENLRRLQREYDMIRKRQEDSTFVARSEYERVLKDLERLKRSLSQDAPEG